MVYNTVMAYPGVLLRYFVWHYTEAPGDIFLVWRNFFWFIGHYFSIPLLFRTLFSPWKRMSEHYQKDGLEALVEVIVLNIMSRMLGFIVRCFLLLLGIITELLLIVSLCVFYAVWVMFPVLSIGSVVIGIALLVP